MVRCATNSAAQTHKVGGKEGSPCGLYDLTGIVWEWCGDWYGAHHVGAQVDWCGPTAGSAHVVRGSGWGFDCRFLRSANRISNEQDCRFNDECPRAALPPRRSQ